MGSAPRVSALIVNYRSYRELGSCLASLKPEFDAGLLEVVVVDNASDASALAPLAERYNFAMYLPREGNPGFGAAVNEAATQARGQLFLLVNPDATVRPEAIKTMVAYLDDHPDVAVVGPRVYDPDGLVQGSARSFPGLLTGMFGRTTLMTRLWPNNPISRHNIPVAASSDEPREVDWVAASCLMVRADAFRAIGGFDPRFFMYWEDADLCKQLRSLGWRVVYLPGATVEHQVGRSSRHATARSAVAFHRSAFRYYAKHRHGRARPVLLAVAAVALGARMMGKLVLAYGEQLKKHTHAVALR